MRIHLVYFHPDKKYGYGATREERWPYRLIEQGLDVSKGRVVEKGLTLEEASRREKELQVKDGYPTDPWDYKKVYDLHHLSQSKESIKKRVKSCDYDKIVQNRKHKQKEINKKIKENSPLKRSIIAYRVKRVFTRVNGWSKKANIVKTETIGTFVSIQDAGKSLKIPPGDISAVLGKRQKTVKMQYTFEYADSK